MERAIVVRGELADARHIELEEPITEIRGKVEVIVRSLHEEHVEAPEDIFDFIASLPPGTRSKEDIDRQIREERESWGDR